MSEDRELRELELAFQLHVVDLVIEADLVETTQESERLETHFPKVELEAAGLLDLSGRRTEHFQRRVAQALASLPGRLDHEAKLDLLHVAVRIAAADRLFRLGEGAVVLKAARLLGLADEEFDAFISAYPEAVGMNAAVLRDDDS